MKRIVHVGVCVVMAGMGAVNAVSPAAGQAGTWRMTQPPANFSQSMAFDSMRGRAVVFGSAYGAAGTYPQDTWEWDGAQWSYQNSGTAGPLGRSSTAMAYDSVRGVVVLFGGYNADRYSVNQGRLSDTWEWDGSTWMERVTTGPSPRYGHAMAYDSNRRVTVLTGGTNSQGWASRDVWEWNGTMWTGRSLAPAQLERTSHEMTYDAQRGRMVVFGGTNTNMTFPADTWEYDGAFWHLRWQTGPQGRQSFGMTYDAARQRTVLHGGSNNGALLGDTWEWSGSRWTRLADGLPRAAFAMAFDAAHGRVLRFGGDEESSDQGSGDLDLFNGESWVSIGKTLPSSDGAAMCFDANRDSMVLYGLRTSNGSYVDETWVQVAGMWNRLAIPGPGGRGLTSIAYDAARRETVLFGGWTWPSNFGDTWRFDGTGWSRVSLSGPSPREGAVMCYDPVRRLIVLFGGTNRLTLERFADMWEWDGNSWTERIAPGPPAGRWGGLVYDQSRNVLVLNAGFTSGTGQTWEWNGIIWTRSAWQRGATGLVFDSRRGVTLGVNLADAHTWNGRESVALATGWLNGLSCIAFDESRGRTIVIATDPHTETTSTHSLRLTCAWPEILTQPETPYVCADGQRSFSAVGSGECTYQWERSIGPTAFEPVTDVEAFNVRISGSRSSTLRIWSRHPSTTRYRCVVSDACGAVYSETVTERGCRLDYNCDETVDMFDYLEFVQAFAEGSTIANFNGDWVVDFFDYLDFLNAFPNGC